MELLRKDHLVDLISLKGRKNLSNTDARKTECPNLANHPRVTKTVNCIIDDLDVSGTSISVAKRHYRSLRYNLSVDVANIIMECENIEFSNEDTSNLSHPHHDALVISILISNSLVKQTLIDNGSSTNVVFTTTLKNMQNLDSEIFQKVTTLVGFGGEPKQTLGDINGHVH